ncbi:MAG: hypothetical protein H0U82_08195 [Actinobacteria bacterium]|nr:hypothetical protein [Actinomycetota bacterium]
MLTTDQKGAIAESAIVHAAIKLGIGVCKPLSDSERYDLIFDLRPNLLRVQCKWGALVGEVVVVRCYSCRRSRDGMLKRSYTTIEVDAIAAFCEPLGKCYFLPMERFDGRSHVQLRIHPSRNNQRIGVNWAEDFAFEARLEALVGP